MNNRAHTACRSSVALAVALVLLGSALAASPAGDAQAVAPPAPDSAAATLAQLQALRQSAVDAYNRRDWSAAANAADSHAAALDAAGLPRAGADYALVSFVGGHARFELWRQAPETFRYDFDSDVLRAMDSSLAILDDDPFFKHNILGAAAFEKLKQDQFRSFDLENQAHWHMLRALLARAEELRETPRESDEYTTFAKYILQYIARSFEMARRSPAADVYLLRVREACRLGFGSQFDDRFVQLYDVVGFDGGNVRAGVLWQAGLDLMNTDGAKPDEVLPVFQEAADAARGPEARAEVFRQMADYASRQDEHTYKLASVEYGRRAFRLNPEDKDIQVQYGTSLHVLSYLHHTFNRFDEALALAREATSFEWDGDEVAYFDLSRAEANFGDKIDAIAHADKAYKKALRKLEGAELAPFRQNLANILRQFGLTAQAAQVERQSQGS